MRQDRTGSDGLVELVVLDECVGETANEHARGEGRKVEKRDVQWASLILIEVRGVHAQIEVPVEQVVKSQSTGMVVRVRWILCAPFFCSLPFGVIEGPEDFEHGVRHDNHHHR